jgi:hypothetical protein
MAFWQHRFDWVFWLIYFDTFIQKNISLEFSKIISHQEQTDNIKRQMKRGKNAWRLDME